ncbi:MAG: hypothetical protein II135_04735 [Clostridia bacterium]|nr:hypothetical protein [Clostridia bacterium]
MSLTTAVIISSIVALILSVLAFVLIMPKSKRDGLNKFFRWVYDLFHFRFLILEYIIKGLYVISTIGSICFGFFLLFSGYESYSSFTGYSFQSYALQGLIIMIGGPIAIRIVFELIMMFILVVKNTSEINMKMDASPSVKSSDNGKPAKSADNKKEDSDELPDL